MQCEYKGCQKERLPYDNIFCLLHRKGWINACQHSGQMINNISSWFSEETNRTTLKMYKEGLLEAR